MSEIINFKIYEVAPFPPGTGAFSVVCHLPGFLRKSGCLILAALRENGSSVMRGSRPPSLSPLN